MRNIILVTFLVLCSLYVAAKQVLLGPNSNSQEEIQEALIDLDPGVMMPESGRSLSHQEAIEMIREWIDKMET